MLLPLSSIPQGKNKSKHSNIKLKQILGKIFLPIVTITILCATLPFGPAALAEEPDVDKFDPGYLISDQELFDFRSLSAQDIQEIMEQIFQGSHGTSVCTDGVDEGGNPIPCLKDYVIPNTVTNLLRIEPRSVCKGIEPTAGKTAAEVVKMVAESCKINPKYLLVLLQKEQGILTRNGSAIKIKNYDRATGYNCPDTAPCVNTTLGFTNQLYRAASQMHRYVDLSVHRGFYRPFKSYDIGYSPRGVSACGSSKLTMKTNATAGMYNYTPYQPNESVLANLGDVVPAGDPGRPCAAYGNATVWRLYTKWFGNATPGSNADSNKSFLRISGADRMETAIAISRRQFPNGAKSVYLARADVLVDALSAGSVQDGPVLLVPSSGEFPQSVKDEIDRLNVETVYVVGSSAVVSEAGVQGVVANTNRKVVRFAGKNRFESAALVAKHVFSHGAKTVYLANGSGPDGNGSPDAIAAGMLVDGPVVYVDEGENTPAKEVVKAIDPQKVVALGGKKVISTNVLRSVGENRQRDRYSGADRIETAVVIANHVFPNGAKQIIIAVDNVYADAVTAGVISDVALLLLPKEYGADKVYAAVAKLHPEIIMAAGGAKAISDELIHTAVRAAREGSYPFVEP